jgi:hypothetical protein
MIKTNQSAVGMDVDHPSLIFIFHFRLLHVSRHYRLEPRLGCN